jgi:hypothetical protein
MPESAPAKRGHGTLSGELRTDRGAGLEVFLERTGRSGVEKVTLYCDLLGALCGELDTLAKLPEDERPLDYWQQRHDLWAQVAELGIVIEAAS